jgi:hypothetical protein
VGGGPVMHDRAFEILISSKFIRSHPRSTTESQRRDFGRHAADFYKTFSVAHFSKNNDKPIDFTNEFLLMLIGALSYFK